MSICLPNSFLHISACAIQSAIQFAVDVRDPQRMRPTFTFFQGPLSGPKNPVFIYLSMHSVNACKTCCSRKAMRSVAPHSEVVWLHCDWIMKSVYWDHCLLKNALSTSCLSKNYRQGVPKTRTQHHFRRLLTDHYSNNSLTRPPRSRLVVVGLFSFVE